MYQPNKHVTTSAAHALGLFFEDIGASLARAAAQHARNDVSSEGGYRFAGSTEGFLLRVKHVDEALRIVLGKKNTPELFKLAVAQGIKAVRKLRSASRLQPTRPTLSSSTYRQSALSLPSSVNVNIEALSSAGSSANLHFDLVPAEKLLNKAILNLMPDSQADNGPVVTCTIGAAVYLTAVLEYLSEEWLEVTSNIDSTIRALHFIKVANEDQELGALVAPHVLKAIRGIANQKKYETDEVGDKSTSRGSKNSGDVLGLANSSANDGVSSASTAPSSASLSRSDYNGGASTNRRVVSSMGNLSVSENTESAAPSSIALAMGSSEPSDVALPGKNNDGISVVGNQTVSNLGNPLKVAASAAVSSAQSSVIPPGKDKNTPRVSSLGNPLLEASTDTIALSSVAPAATTLSVSSTAQVMASSPLPGPPPVLSSSSNVAAPSSASFAAALAAVVAAATPNAGSNSSSSSGGGTVPVAVLFRAALAAEAGEALRQTHVALTSAAVASGADQQSHGTSSPFSQPPSMVGGFGGMPTQFASNLGNPQPAPFGITPSTSTSSGPCDFGQGTANKSRFDVPAQRGGGIGGSMTSIEIGVPAQGGAGFGGSPFCAPAHGGGGIGGSTGFGFGAPSNETFSSNSRALNTAKVGHDAPSMVSREQPVKSLAAVPASGLASPPASTKTNLDNNGLPLAIGLGVMSAGQPAKAASLDDTISPILPSEMKISEIKNKKNDLPDYETSSNENSDTDWENADESVSDGHESRSSDREDSCYESSSNSYHSDSEHLDGSDNSYNTDSDHDSDTDVSDNESETSNGDILDSDGSSY